MNIIEYLRKEVIIDLFRINSFNNNWNTLWREQINEKILTSGQISSQSILDLGDELGDIFKNARSAGRTQSGVSAAGTTWEGLICWYLNFCLINTNVVVIKQKKSNMPKPISDALTVMYGASPSNTEADLIAVVFPNTPDYNIDINLLNTLPIFEGINLFKRNNTFKHKEALNELVNRDSNDIQINVIQCKTNWNDNAQIPMLWDMVYNAQGFQRNNISVGVNNYSLNSFNRFSYSFVTVPTTNRAKIRTTSVAVKRVCTLSGGNYWGYPTSNNISSSIKDIFNRNFSAGIIPNIRTSLTNSLPDISTEFTYFNL